MKGDVYMSHERAMELLAYAINYIVDNASGNTEVEDFYEEIGITTDELNEVDDVGVDNIDYVPISEREE